MLNNTEITNRNPAQSKILGALRRVLTPLIRLALAQGVNYPMLLETLKAVFVQVAEEEFKLEARRQTDSRISLLTGLHRKDVHRLRDQSQTDSGISATASLGSQLVGLWITNPEFTDSQGNPKPLPRYASMNQTCSFEHLVASVSKDIRARPVLDEWLRVGVVHVDENDFVRLNTEAFVPNAGFDEKLYFFQQNIHDHLAATAHNLMNISPPMLERCVYYDNLTPAAISELRLLAEEHGMTALKAVNRRAIELQSAQLSAESADQRFTFAMYFFHEKEDSAFKSAYDEHQNKNKSQ